MSANPLEGPVLDLSRLAKGDRVGVQSRNYDNYYTGTVYRLTRTQVVVSVHRGSGAPLHQKFRLSDGGEVGVGYGAKLVHPDDPSLIRHKIGKVFDDLYSQAAKDHREARNQRPHIQPKDMAAHLSALSERIAEARARIAALSSRLPGAGKPATLPEQAIARLACTDCTRETTNLVYQGRWCRELPDSNDGCPGFLLAVLAVPDGQ